MDGQKVELRLTREIATGAILPALEQERQRLIERLVEIESHIVAITGAPRTIAIPGKVPGIAHQAPTNGEIHGLPPRSHDRAPVTVGPAACGPDRGDADRADAGDDAREVLDTPAEPPRGMKALPTTETAPVAERPAPGRPRLAKTKAVIDRDTGERWDSAAIAAAALGLKDRVAVYNHIAGNSTTVAGRRLAWADSMPAATEPSSAPTPKRDFTARPIVDPNAPPAPINADTIYIPREVETQEVFDARRRREEREARRKAETFPSEGGA